VKERSRKLAVTTLVAVLVLTGSASGAFIGLAGDGSQINNDPGNGIDPAQDAGVSDVAGGSVAAGGVNVPWATFEQKVTGAQHIFVRAFQNGAWTTQGQSLNMSTLVQAEAPSIDFAGADRSVPWVSWYEPNTGFATTQIFASRFCATASAICGAGNIWNPEGQDRASGVPSLNINTDRDAENPSVAGGAAVPGTDPAPWVAWQEIDGAGNKDQIFVSKAAKQSSVGASCSGFHPAGGASLGFFCWQQVGLHRLSKTDGSSSSGDPTLNIDPTRNGVEPDVAFAGANDKVAWVVWYETGLGTLGLRSNDQVFAAKIVDDGGADGGFHWQAVGRGTAGQGNALDRSGTNSFGPCAASTAAEDTCSLNKVASHPAVDPRVAAGTLTPGEPTVPWVTWSEDIGGTHAIFVSRLVGSDHFELFNGGQPISNITHDATAPDITFSGNVPYVSWLENIGGLQRGFYGHFEGGAASPVFRLDTPASGVPLAPAATPASLVPGIRSPISSGCTANPFTSDGSACPGGAVGTPFFLFTTDGPPQKLFGQAYQPSEAGTGSASGIGGRTATLNGSVNPGGPAVKVHFDFGTTTAYGSATPTLTLGATTTPAAFSASLSGLSSQKVFHYRAVVQSDFGTLVGADRTFKTKDVTRPKLKLKVLTKRIRQLLRSHRLELTLRVSEAARVTLTGKRSRKRTIAKGAVRLRKAGKTRVSLKVSRKARRALRHRRKAKILVTAVARDAARNKTTVRVKKTLRR
jgi:hypothetical protein